MPQAIIAGRVLAGPDFEPGKPAAHLGQLAAKHLELFDLRLRHEAPIELAPDAWGIGAGLRLGVEGDAGEWEFGGGTGFEPDPTVW